MLINIHGIEFGHLFKVVSINEEGLKMTEELTKKTGHPIR